MSQKSFQDIIRKQDEENNRLRQSEKRVPQSDIQNKYKKALKEIAGIINANRQLKRQLQSLKYNRGNELENYSKAQREQYQKAYQKIVKEKNQMMIANQNLNLQNQKLKSTVDHLEHYIQDLKTQLKSLEMQKESLEKAGKSKNPDKTQKINIDKQQLAYLKQREEDFKKFLENYQRHNEKMISDKIKLEDEIDQLRSRLQKTQLRWTSDLNMKQQEIYEARDQVKKEYVMQINAMKTQNGHLRNKLNQYQIKIQTMQIATQYNTQNQPNQYDMELLYALREVKSQIQPMKAEIASLQDQNQFEKQQNIRDRANLKMKVIELQSELQQVRDNSKTLETKLLQAHEKERMLDDQEKLIHRLQQENRMLGGRIIVLQSKDVALRNRNGEELQEKVLEFQTRVEMLLNQKQNLSNVKNVSIHQMIALKAYIMQLDSKLRSLMNENEYSNKKYRNYKEKYQGLLKEITKYEDVFTSYKSKINAYEKLIQRLQNQLERALTDLENAPQTGNRITTITQQSITSTQIFKRRYNAVKQKLQLQEKYAKQQLDTTRLNYQTKIMQISMQLQQLDNLKQTIELFKSKNEQLIQESIRRDNEIVELRSNARQRKDELIQEESNKVIKQLREQINTLNMQITELQTTIFKSKVTLRQSEDEYKKRITVLERQIESYKEQLERKNRKTILSHQMKSFEESHELYKYKKRVDDLELELASQKEINSRAPFNEEYKAQAYIMEISNLKIDLQDSNRKLETLQNTKKRLENQLKQAQQQNQKLEAVNYQQQRQYRQKIQQYVLSIERKDEEYRSQSYQINTSNTEMNFKLMQQQSNTQKLIIQFQALKATNQRLEFQNQKQIERINNFTNQIEQFRYKNDLLNEQNEKLQTNFTRMQYKKKQMETKLRMKENQFSQLQNQSFSMKAKLESIVMLERKIGEYENELMEKDTKINKLNIDLNKLNKENALIYEKDTQINQLTSQLNKLKITFTSDSESLISQINDLTQTNHELEVKIKNFMISNNNKEDQIEDLNGKIYRYERQLSEFKNKCYEQQSDLFEMSNNLQRLNSQLTKNIQKLKNSQITITEYESIIMKLKSDNSQLNVYRKQYDDIVEDNRNKQDYIRKLSTQIRSLQLKIETDDVEEKESIINRLRTENSMMRADLTSQINHLQNVIGDRDQQIHRLNVQIAHQRQGRLDIGNRHQQIQENLNYATAHLRQIQNELHEKQIQIAQFERQKLQFRNQYNQLKQTLQELTQKNENMNSVIKQRQGQLYQLRQTCEDYQNQCIEKDRSVGKLTYELSFLKQQMQNYQLDLNHKQQNINRLNGQVLRLRQENSTNFQNMSDKDQAIYQINFELNGWKSKYQYLESQLKIKESTFNQLSQQNQKLHLQLGNFEQEKQSRDILFVRLKNQNEILKSQIERLNEQITFKNTEISKLNKQSYQKQFDIENSQRQELWTIQQEVTNMKFNVSSLQIEVKQREEIIERLRNQLKTAKEQKPINNFYFTEEDYMRIKEDNFSLQRQLTNLRGQLSDKQFEISQLQNKITFNAKLMKQEKSTYEEQISYMQKEIEAYIIKERNMTEEINNGEVTNRKLEQLKMGLKMYEQEVDRLTTIVDELQREVQQLRLKLNYLINQQDRITQNLMTLTLSFAEIESLRNLIVEKEKQLEKARENVRTLTRIDATEISNEQRSLRLQDEQRSFSRKADSPIKNRTIVIERIANIVQGSTEIMPESFIQRQNLREQSQRSRSLMNTSHSREENFVQRSYSPPNFAFIPQQQRYGIVGYQTQNQTQIYPSQTTGYYTNVHQHQVAPLYQGAIISQLPGGRTVVRSSQVTSQQLSGSKIISRGINSPPHSMYQSGERRF